MTHIMCGPWKMTFTLVSLGPWTVISSLNSKSNVQTMQGGSTPLQRTLCSCFLYIILFLFWFLFVFKYNFSSGFSSLLK